MQEPEEISQTVVNQLLKSQDLQGFSALVTAGPTYEPIDPVRFIGNYSSGLMGFSIAEELARRGAQVTLIAGPTYLTTYHPNIQRVDVKTAEQMLRACLHVFPSAQIAIKADSICVHGDNPKAVDFVQKIHARLEAEGIKAVNIAEVIK